MDSTPEERRIVKYIIRWRGRVEHFQAIYAELFDQQALCDVTLVNDKDVFKAHKIVLSACSTYFRNIFDNFPTTQHAIVVLKDVSSLEIRCILDYVYKGETVVPVELMPCFLKTCMYLKIQELCPELGEDEERAYLESLNSLNDENNSGDLCRVETTPRGNTSSDTNKKRRNNTNMDDECITSKHSRSVQTNEGAINIPADLTPDVNDAFESDILLSPPNSPQSMIFSIENAVDMNEKHTTAKMDESISILSPHKSAPIVISDDESPISTHSDADQETDRQFTQTQFLNALLLQESQDTDESEIIITNRTRKRRCARKLSSDKEACNDDEARKILGEKEQAIPDRHLKIVLNKMYNKPSGHCPDSDALPEENIELDETGDNSLSTEETEPLVPSKSVCTSEVSNSNGDTFLDNTVYSSIQHVPNELRKFYCLTCLKCIKPDLIEKHAYEHSSQFAQKFKKHLGATAEK